MPRISTPALEFATGATAEIYAQIKKAVGKVPNTFATIGAHGPAALKAILQADGVLAASTLSKQDQETVKLIVSEVAGCDYCVAAHSLLGKLAGLKPDVLKQMRAGQPTGDARGRAPLPSCMTCRGLPGSRRISPALSCNGRPPAGSSSVAEPASTAWYGISFASPGPWSMRQGAP